MGDVLTGRDLSQIWGATDILYGGPGNDVLIGGWKLDGGPGDDRLSFGSYALGGPGNDVLIRGGNMAGGPGNDTYFVTYLPDFWDVRVLGWTPPQNVLERGGQGVDTVKSGVSIDLNLFGRFTDFWPDPDTFLYPFESSAIERLILTGKADVDGTGNALANVLIGNLGDNYLYGGLGADTLRGRWGDDVLDGAEGHDRLIGGPGADVFHF